MLTAPSSTGTVGAGCCSKLDMVGWAAASVYVSPMPDTMLRAFGWRPLLVHGDPCVLDRWLWLRRHLRRGTVSTFDAGCGNGGFSIYAARAGNEVVAASFAPSEQEAAS